MSNEDTSNKRLQDILQYERIYHYDQKVLYMKVMMNQIIKPMRKIFNGYEK